MRRIRFSLILLGGLLLLGCGTTDPDSVTITSPAYGATISGNTTVKAEVNGDAFEVSFFIDGTEYPPPDNSIPYEYTWDTTHEVNGSHTIKAEARFSAGELKSDEITVTVQN